MTSYNRSRTCRDDFIEMTLHKSEQIYFAAHLLHGCTRAHQALLPSYPALPLQFRSRCPVAQPMSRFDIQVLCQGFTQCTRWRGQTNLCTRLLFADCRPLHITQRYQRLVICRPLLSSEYCSEETNLKASWHPPGTLHYRPVPLLYRFCGCNALLLAAHQRYTH